VGAVAAFALLWAAVEFIARGAGIQMEQLVWMRYFIHVLALMLVFGWRRGWGLVRTVQPVMHIGRSLLMLVMPISFILAADRIGASQTTTVFWVMPMMILTLLRTTDALRWLLAVIAYAAVVLIIDPPTIELNVGLMFAVAMGASLAGYVWLTEKLSDDVVVNLFHSALWVMIALTVRMPFIWQWPSPEGWLSIVGVGLGGLATLWMLDMGIRLGGAKAVVSTVWLQPVFELVLRSGIAERRVALGVSVICAVVVSGLFLHRERRQSGAAYSEQVKAEI
jgi:hypothetical protein